ncbi:hypothetical protein GCM10010420_45700 [Streptomyces glaucosporus]|uniref:Uncharacterized protein n=1 Tax=Streptomyces glaucosporus TaxID=284044 RepID=A0ABP5VTI8_9ACTN
MWRNTVRLSGRLRDRCLTAVPVPGRGAVPRRLGHGKPYRAGRQSPYRRRPAVSGVKGRRGVRPGRPNRRLEIPMRLTSPALPQEPADGIAGWAADLVDTLGGPGAGPAIALENLAPPRPAGGEGRISGGVRGPAALRRRSARWCRAP